MRDPTDILDSHAEDHPKEVIDQAREVLEAWRGHRQGQDPKGGAAAAVYAAYLTEGYDVEQSSVAESFNSSEVTLRERLHEMADIGILPQ